MRDEGQHVLRMLRDESERVHRTAAAREEIDRPGVQRLDDPMQVARMVVGVDSVVGSTFVLRSDPRGS